MRKSNAKTMGAAPMKTILLAAAALVAMTGSQAEAAQAKAKATKAAKAPAAPQSPFQAGRPALKVRPVGDKAVIHTVADAVGLVRGVGPGETTSTINRVKWIGAGTAAGANGALVKATYSYTVSLSLKAAREDIQRGASDRSVKVVLDQMAWDESEPGVGGKLVNDQAQARRLQLARSPFGFVQALLKADPATVKVTDPGPGGVVTLSLPIEGVPTTATLDADYRPRTITMTVGPNRMETTYTNYRDLAEYGLMFPTRIVEKANGKTTLDVAITDGRVASYAVFPPPSGLGK